MSLLPPHTYAQPAACTRTPRYMLDPMTTAPSHPPSPTQHEAQDSPAYDAVCTPTHHRWWRAYLTRHSLAVLTRIADALLSALGAEGVIGWWGVADPYSVMRRRDYTPRHDVHLPVVYVGIVFHSRVYVFLLCCSVRSGVRRVLWGIALSVRAYVVRMYVMCSIGSLLCNATGVLVFM